MDGHGLCLLRAEAIEDETPVTEGACLVEKEVVLGGGWVGIEKESF